MHSPRRSITEDELSIFFSLIGQGIWYLQHVENALATCITVKGEIKELGQANQQQADQILAKHRRNTFGTSLKIAEEKKILSDQLMVALQDFKKERDWLVHRSMNENGDNLYTDDGIYSVLIRLNTFLETAKSLQKLVAKELEDFVVSKGVSRNWIYERANQEIRTKRGE